MSIHEPIAAISTPYGRGGIAVIRMSGDGVVTIAERVFLPSSRRSLATYPAREAVYGTILFDGKPIDDGIATFFLAPHSFTGEDVVEISCHGGIALTQKVLEAVLLAGCRPARAGEFSQRAFLNGKMGLSQAEAVIGLIDASSDEQLSLSYAMAKGTLHNKIHALTESLADLLSSLYAYIDYPDEDLTDYTHNEVLDAVKTLHTELERLLATYKTGHAVNEGIKTVILGKPNVGKSSLLNRLLGKDRAIVTDVPGTTRDTLEETVEINGVTLRLCDTAGLRETGDRVEREGVSRTRKKVEEAELILALFDAAAPLDEEDETVIDLLAKTHGAVVLPIVNKSDKADRIPCLPFERAPLFLSALNGDGIEALKEAIASLYIEEKIDYNKTPVLANARQFVAASKAEEALNTALTALEGGFTQDVAGLDLERALEALTELDGRAVSQEITDRIFSRFCIGK